MAWRLALECQYSRTPWQEAVVHAVGAGVAPLVEELQVAGVDGLGLVGVAADQVAVADVVGPGRAAVCLAGEGVALAGGLRCPRTVQAAGRERAEVAPVGPDRLDDHQ